MWSYGSERFSWGRGHLSPSQRTHRRSQSPMLVCQSTGSLTCCCETVILHYLFTIDICIGKGKEIQGVIFISALSPSLCFSLYFFPPDCLIFLYLSVSHLVCPISSCSISFILPPSVYPAFLWNVMIHWLWSLWAVSLKSACLLSATTEWYITYIPCNFLGFIRYIYLPYNGEDCSFLQSSECLSLTPRPCSWKPLSGMEMCQD